MNLPIFLLLAAFIALQLGDWYTTTRALAHGAREANPAMAWLMRHIGVQPALIAKVIVASLCAAVVALGMPPKLAIIILLALCALFGWVVVHNWRVVR